jgi:hypothetical protein
MTRRAALLHAITPRASSEEDPISLMRRALAGERDAVATVRAGVEKWAREGGSFDECMGWRAPPGGRHKTARARLVAAARYKVVRTLIVDVAGENPHRQTQAILPVVAGDAPAPSAEASQALDELRALGANMPRSKGGIYSLVVQAISAK